MNKMTRFGISVEQDLLTEFDLLIRQKGYANRSKAIRDLIRSAIIAEAWENETGEKVGTITLIYDHHRHDLAQKLISIQHDSPVHVSATMHIHLDHHNCMEILAAVGQGNEIRKLADQLISLKGVKHGQLIQATTKNEP